MPNRIFFNIAYNGAYYHGWQKQLNAPAVQDVIDKNFRKVLQENIRTIGCGRTDTGVHAKNFYFHFDTEQDFEPTFLEKANHILPRSIWVKSMLEPTQDDAHSRYSAQKRTYDYYICTSRNPFYLNTATYYHHAVDLDLMNQGCQILMEYENFETFSKLNKELTHYKCQLHEAYWEQVNHELIRFRITANRFIRRMVRMIVITLIYLGSGKVSLDHLRYMIESRNRNLVKGSAPPDGLYLAEVTYPDDLLKEVASQSWASYL